MGVLLKLVVFMPISHRAFIAFLIKCQHIVEEHEEWHESGAINMKLIFRGTA